MLPTTFYGNQKQPFNYLEPQATIYKWMFGETTILYIKIWNHPIETTIYNWLFGVMMAKTPMVFLLAKNKAEKTLQKFRSFRHRMDIGLCSHLWMEFTMAMWLSVSGVLRGFEEGSAAQEVGKGTPPH